MLKINGRGQSPECLAACPNKDLPQVIEGGEREGERDSFRHFYCTDVVVALVKCSQSCRSAVDLK